MSMEEGQMHAIAGASTVVLTAAMCLPFILPLFFSQCAGEDIALAPLEEMEVIEASLAMRKNSKKQAQPQKDMQPPDPTKKPDGVSRDENKKVDDKKPDEKKPDEKSDQPIDLNQFKRPDGETTPGPITEPFNPNESTEIGNDTETRGDPYFGRLKTEMDNRFRVPEIAKNDAAAQPPVGCFHLLPDGTIASDTKFKQEGVGDVQLAAETALKDFVGAINRKPTPVPEHLLKYTSRFICFKFKVGT